MLFTWALVLREVCIRSGPEWGVFELDGIQTLLAKLLNTASTNMCIEKGLPPGTENTLFRMHSLGRLVTTSLTTVVTTYLNTLVTFFPSESSLFGADQ